jgi:hypothetical protein
MIRLRPEAQFVDVGTPGKPISICLVSPHPIAA